MVSMKVKKKKNSFQLSKLCLFRLRPLTLRCPLTYMDDCSGVIPYGIYKIGTTPLRLGSYSHSIISKDVYTTVFGRNALFEIVQEIFYLEHDYLEPSRKSANIEYRRFWAYGMKNWYDGRFMYEMGNAEHVTSI